MKVITTIRIYLWVLQQCLDNLYMSNLCRCSQRCFTRMIWVLPVDICALRQKCFYPRRFIVARCMEELRLVGTLQGRTTTVVGSQTR